MKQQRIDLYHKIETIRSSKLLVYVTGDRSGMETQIAPDVLHKFSEHLDLLPKTDKITLLLYTNGGETSTAWSLVNLIRNFCSDFEVIVPANSFSSGTLICLGTDRIIMTKQATLGPIDPSVNGPMNPMVLGTNDPNAKIPVSVEDVQAYITMAKDVFGISDSDSLAKVLVNLSDKIHPLTLGQVYKSRNQIKMLANKLLQWHPVEDGKKDAIINFLCSESGSHDYSIRRKEAMELGMKVEIPNDELYFIIKSIYSDIREELELDTPFNPNLLLANHNNISYSFRRVLVESAYTGTDVFLSEGELVKQTINNPGQPYRVICSDNRIFEGWKHEK